MNPITGIIQVIDVHLRSPCFNIYLKDKSNNFEIQRILCYSRYIALRFQLLQCECQSFTNTKKNCLINSVCFQV